MMAREVRIERRGARGLSDAEQQFLAGNIAEPTTAALDEYRRAPALSAATQVQQQADAALVQFSDAVGAYALTVPPNFPYAPPGSLITFPEGFAA